MLSVLVNSCCSNLEKKFERQFSRKHDKLQLNLNGMTWCSIHAGYQYYLQFKLQWKFKTWNLGI